MISILWGKRGPNYEWQQKQELLLQVCKYHWSQHRCYSGGGFMKTRQHFLVSKKHKNSTSIKQLATRRCLVLSVGPGINRKCCNFSSCSDCEEIWLAWLKVTHKTVIQSFYPCPAFSMGLSPKVKYFSWKCERSCLTCEVNLKGAR